LAAGPVDSNISKYFGLVAVTLAAVNIFGGFVVTNRMLSMFKKKQ
jgi:NAD(P) transhydrogenase subunit alpha